ncbi:monocarboxylate permease-like protein, partial [Moniliophthora roreri]
IASLATAQYDQRKSILTLNPHEQARLRGKNSINGIAQADINCHWDLLGWLFRRIADILMARSLVFIESYHPPPPLDAAIQTQAKLVQVYGHRLLDVHHR